MIRSAVVNRPLNPAALLDEVSQPGNGAAVLFVGTVRDQNDGREVTGIDYEAYLGMAARELAAVVGEAESAHAGCSIVVEHRVGALGVGEASVVIATAHSHRDQAYAASRQVIEQLKRRVPIWKRELYADGTREWVHAGTGAPVEEVLP